MKRAFLLLLVAILLATPASAEMRYLGSQGGDNTRTVTFTFPEPVQQGEDLYCVLWGTGATPVGAQLEIGPYKVRRGGRDVRRPGNRFVLVFYEGSIPQRIPRNAELTVTILSTRNHLEVLCLADDLVY